MEHTISNKLGHKAPMSMHAINDVMNARLIMHQLRDDNISEENKNQLSVMLHKHIVGW